MAKSDASPSPRPRKRLPVNPSAEHLKKQAKRRVKADSSLQLAAVQLQLAQEYGCKSWAELMHVVETMSRGADQLVGVKRDYEPLPAAARKRDLAAVRAILDSGQYTPHDLDAGLAHAAWYGGGAPQVLAVRKEIFDLLLEHGSDPDGQYGSNYGPIVFGCGECVEPDGLRWLLDAGCDVTFKPVDTKYGVQCALSYGLGTYVRGQNERKHQVIELLLGAGAFIPPEVTPPILAIHRGHARELADLIDRDPDLPRRTFRDMPYGNIDLKGATLLHCAVEFGEIECIDVLLDRWFDCNPRAEVIDGIGGQTPVYHAIANNGDGNLYTLEHLVKRLSYSIDTHIRATFRRYGNVHAASVTPLEFAEECAADANERKWRKRIDEELALLKSVIWTSPSWPPSAQEERTPRKQLERACAAGDFNEAKRIVESAQVPAAQLHHGIGACMPKHADIARYLIEHGADINADCVPDYGSLLVGACEGLDDEQVKYLLDLGADAVCDPNRVTKCPAANTPLRMTLNTYVRGRIHAKHRIIQMLLERGAKPDNALLLTIHRGDTKTLRKMLDADPSLVDRRFPDLTNTESFAPLRGGTLLHLAVEHNERECCEELLKRHADINARADVIDGVGGHTPVFHAAHSWQGTGYPMLQYLVERCGNRIDTSIKAKLREGQKIVEKTVLEYADERERKLLGSLGRGT